MHWSTFFVFVLATQGPKRKRISRWIAHSIHGLAFMAWHSSNCIHGITILQRENVWRAIFFDKFMGSYSIYIYIHSCKYIHDQHEIAGKSKSNRFLTKWHVLVVTKRKHAECVCMLCRMKFACYMLPWKKSKSGMLSFFGRSAGLMDSPSGLVFCNFKS